VLAGRVGQGIWACPEIPIGLGGALFLFFLFSAPKFLAVDPVALSYILQNDDTF
jgi:hypothetical protein